MGTTTKTSAPKSHRHFFRICNKVKSYTVYEIAGLFSGTNLLANVLRIESFQGKSNTFGVTKYLRLKTTANWNSSEAITGLRRTSVNGIYYGDRIKDGEKSLLIFLFTEVKTGLFEEPELGLIIDVFPGFYTSNKGILQKIINTY